MARRVLTAREQVAMTGPWLKHAGDGADLRWERDAGGDWILVGRNPDGNPVAVRTERAPSVRTSHRTAAFQCPHHGGDWGDDEMCTTCCNSDGEPRPLPNDQTSQTIDHPSGHRIEREGDFYTAVDEDGLGMGFLHAPVHNGHRYVNRIEINPEHQGQGVGRALWEAAGQPLHLPEDHTSQGFNWVTSVGGQYWHEPTHGPQPNWHHTSHRTAMPLPEQAHDTDLGQDWADEPRSTSRTFNGPWFHASPHELAEGTVIRPRGGESPYGDKYDTTGTTGRQDWVWMETEPGGIHHWAQQGQAPNIYLVEPHDGPYPWNNTGMEGWVANGATVVSKISDNGTLPKGFVPQWVAEQRAKNAHRTAADGGDYDNWEEYDRPEDWVEDDPLENETEEKYLRRVYKPYPAGSPDLPEHLRPHTHLPIDVVHHYREFDRPYDKNTRMVERIIADQGIRQPLKISTDGTHAILIEGNHRLQAARRLGLTHLPVQVFLEKPGEVMNRKPDEMLALHPDYHNPAPLEPVLRDWIDKNQHKLRSFWD